ncbi:hypothetical protein LINPERHAP2_LOCUS16911 [Linum perenne]
MILNTDGSVNPMSKRVTSGGLLRDKCGHFFFVFSSNLGICSITKVELRGIATRLRLVWDAGFRLVFVQSDSMTDLALISAECQPQHQHTSEVSII